LTAREPQRVMVLNRVERGDVTGEEAARLVGLSVRQERRLLAAYRKEGVAALAHGYQGRPPVHRIPEETRKRVVALSQAVYQGLNHHHLRELLLEREQWVLSRSSVWRILTAAGIPSPWRRRPPQHRCRRERYPQERMLLQVDGSRHDWLEGRGPYRSLVEAIDDATGAVLHALFREREDAPGYLLKQGTPVALYSNRHSIFQVNPKERESLQEQPRFCRGSSPLMWSESCGSWATTPSGPSPSRTRPIIGPPVHRNFRFQLGMRLFGLRNQPIAS
jgi:transposase